MKTKHIFIRTLSTLLIILAILSFITFGFSGCADKYPDNPTDVVLDFALSLADQNVNRAERYCTKSFKGTDDFKNLKAAVLLLKGYAPEAKLTLMEKKELSDLLKDIFNDSVSEKIEGNTAKVWLKGFSSFTCTLKKESKLWKIDGSEIRLSIFESALSNMNNLVEPETSE